MIFRVLGVDRKLGQRKDNQAHVQARGEQDRHEGQQPHRFGTMTALIAPAQQDEQGSEQKRDDRAGQNNIHKDPMPTAAPDAVAKGQP
ncbi:hypothetical protein D9M69_624910 [compost metagenome]